MYMKLINAHIWLYTNNSYNYYIKLCSLAMNNATDLESIE